MLDEGQLLGHEQRVSGPVERVLALKRLPVVNTLTGPQLALVADEMSERYFPKGTVMLREGEPPAALYFPIEGRVHITRAGRLLGHARPGLAVGPFHVLARDQRGLGATADTDTVALELSAERLTEIFEEHFAILHTIIREVSRLIVEQAVRYPQVAALLPGSPEGAPTASRELDLVERIFFLRRSPVFEHASISALAQLSRTLTEVRYPPGTVLWREGEATGWGSLIVSGTVRARSSRGHDFTAGPGVALGGLDAVAEIPRWFDAVTETPVVALQASIQGLVDVFEDNFGMAMDYLAVMARWLLVIYDRSLAARDRLQRVYGGDPETAAAEAGTGAAPAAAP
jgi:CRP-like cAMP-binding protein